MAVVRVSATKEVVPAGTRFLATAGEAEVKVSARTGGQYIMFPVILDNDVPGTQWLKGMISLSEKAVDFTKESLDAMGVVYEVVYSVDDQGNNHEEVIFDTDHINGARLCIEIGHQMYKGKNQLKVEKILPVTECPDYNPAYEQQFAMRELPSTEQNPADDIPL